MTIENVINKIRVDLNDARCTLLKWCEEDISLLQYQPRQGGWSALGVLEHITLTSHYLLMIIDKASTKAMQRALSDAIPNDWESYELVPKGLEDIGIHKSFSWNRPDHMEPSHRATPSDIKKRMNEQFDKCDRLLSHLKNGEGRLRKTTMSVNGIGKLDVYQYIYFLILHAKRHVTQLDQNKIEFNQL